MKQLAALAATAVVLIATSRAPEPCATEQINVLADTTCGMPANVVLTSNSSCSVTSMGAGFAGLPASGSIQGGVVDGGFDQGFSLSGTSPDGGSRSCNATAADGGFAINCGECSGTLTPQ